VLARLVQPVGLAELHQHALGAGGDQRMRGVNQQLSRDRTRRGSSATSGAPVLRLCRICFNSSYPYRESSSLRDKAALTFAKHLAADSCLRLDLAYVRLRYIHAPRKFRLSDFCLYTGPKRLDYQHSLQGRRARNLHLATGQCSHRQGAVRFVRAMRERQRLAARRIVLTSVT